MRCDDVFFFLVLIATLSISKMLDRLEHKKTRMKAERERKREGKGDKRSSHLVVLTKGFVALLPS